MKVILLLMFSCCHVWLFVTPWTIAHQAPLSMGFLRQEYGNGLPSPCPDNRDVWCMYKGSRVLGSLLPSSLPPSFPPAPSPPCLLNEWIGRSCLLANALLEPQRQPRLWPPGCSASDSTMPPLVEVCDQSQGFAQLGVGSLPGGEAEGLVGNGQGPRGRNTHHGGKRVSRSSQGHLSGVRDSARQEC